MGGSGLSVLVVTGPDRATHYEQAELSVWIRGCRLEGVMHVTPDVGKPRQPIICKSRACDLEGVGFDWVPWTEVCFIELLCVRDNKI